MKSRLLVLLMLLAPALFAQQGKFRVEFDYGRYSYDDTANYFEVYYSFYQAAMKAVDEGGQKSVKGLLTITVRDLKTADTTVHRDYQFRTVLPDSGSAASKSLVGNLGFVLPFGAYECVLTGTDQNMPSQVDSFKFQFQMLPLPNDKFYISDLQFAQSIRKSEDQSSLFYKNTYEVVPNPANLYGEAMPVLYYYAEIYNINVNAQSEVLRLDQVVLNSRDHQVYHKSKYISRKNSSVVEAGAINVNKLPTGTYTMLLTVADTTQNLKALMSKKFFVFNASIADTIAEKGGEAGFMSSEFAAMGEEELAEVFSISKYVATKAEINKWGSITDLDGKRNFMFNFWKDRDRDLSTPENEYKRDYFKRVSSANSQFGTFQKKGWQTDRGRVFIMYGEPSEIERHPNEVDTKPYEVWLYHNMEGGVEFVFGDLTGFSDYMLLHSTLRGELRDDNWVRKVKSM